MGDDVVDELAWWLASRPVAWMRHTGLAVLVACRATELVPSAGVGGGAGTPAIEPLLRRWRRALCRGRTVEASVAAIAVAWWAGASEPVAEH